MWLPGMCSSHGREDAITQHNNQGWEELQQNNTLVVFLFKSHSFSMGMEYMTLNKLVPRVAGLEGVPHYIIFSN